VVLVVGFDVDLGTSHFPDDAKKLLYRNRSRAGFLDLCFNAACDGNVEICGGEFKAVVLGVDEDVGKDWQRGARADYILNGLKAVDELVFLDGQVDALNKVFLRNKYYQY